MAMNDGLSELFSKIDALLLKGRVILAIEGGSAGGKTTLGNILLQKYDCSLIHADDFFLPPEKRTAERLCEVGGNFDRERFYDEVVLPLTRGETVEYRPFLCSSSSFGEKRIIEPNRLTVVEGAYSAHQDLGRYYDILAFLDIDEDYQRKRILRRNTPDMAERFFGEWIPYENAYFSATEIKKRSDIIIPIKENEAKEDV